MTQSPIHASCLCGGISLQLAELPRHYYQCHCSLCRKQGGAASSAATIVQTDHITWLKGMALVTCYQKPTGFKSYFCQTCGSPLPNPIGDVSLSWFPLGILDDPVQITLTMHLFTNSMASWEPAPAGGVCHRDMPPVQEILEALRG